MCALSTLVVPTQKTLTPPTRLCPPSCLLILDSSTADLSLSSIVKHAPPPPRLTSPAIISHSPRIAICNSVCSRQPTRSHTVSMPYDCDAVLTHPCPPTRVFSLLVSAPISPSPSHPQESLFNAASIRSPDRLLGSALRCLSTLKRQPLVRHIPSPHRRQHPPASARSSITHLRSRLLRPPLLLLPHPVHVITTVHNRRPPPSETIDV
ncbi:hypothetical protein K466DRAFT_372748 [Polyporus arcularius HHB13444]|uniref:Uncharacterized protein n=1 Tax=Polyporus arcularius HHB13444 TaxID=1314778 RepID=A0A5C3PNL5_9APHY|nr:hypothetical protein K466DRAFT_372748 [Polyporus arcularius HHB13444]